MKEEATRKIDFGRAEFEFSVRLGINECFTRYEYSWGGDKIKEPERERGNNENLPFKLLIAPRFREFRTRKLLISYYGLALHLSRITSEKDKGQKKCENFHLKCGKLDNLTFRKRIVRTP